MDQTDKTQYIKSLILLQKLLHELKLPRDEEGMRVIADDKFKIRLNWHSQTHSSIIAFKIHEGEYNSDRDNAMLNFHYLTDGYFAFTTLSEYNKISKIDSKIIESFDKDNFDVDCWILTHGRLPKYILEFEDKDEYINRL